MDVDHPDLFALCHQVIDSFLGCFCGRAHQDDDPFRVVGTVVIVQVIIAAGQLVDLLHIVFNRVWHSGEAGVQCFAALEENIWVDGSPAGCWMFWVQ